MYGYSLPHNVSTVLLLLLGSTSIIYYAYKRIKNISIALCSLGAIAFLIFYLIKSWHLFAGEWITMLCLGIALLLNMEYEAKLKIKR